MVRLTKFQRQVVEMIGTAPTKEAMKAAAARFGTSLGKIRKAVVAAGGGPVVKPIDLPESEYDDDGLHVKPTTFQTTANASVKEAWIDAYGGLWLESNDKDRVVVPRKQLQKMLQLLR